LTRNSAPTAVMQSAGGFTPLKENEKSGVLLSAKWLEVKEVSCLAAGAKRRDAPPPLVIFGGNRGLPIKNYTNLKFTDLYVYVGPCFV